MPQQSALSNRSGFYFLSFHVGFFPPPAPAPHRDPIGSAPGFVAAFFQPESGAGKDRLPNTVSEAAPLQELVLARALVEDGRTASAWFWLRLPGQSLPGHLGASAQ